MFDDKSEVSSDGSCMEFIDEESTSTVWFRSPSRSMSLFAMDSEELRYYRDIDKVKLFVPKKISGEDGERADDRQ